MGDQLDDDRDEEWFKQVYGTEYTGPPRASSAPAAAAVAGGPAAKGSIKRLPTAVSDSEEDEGPPHDPNAVPTDFTSREAKVWEAKAKAVERNWKRRKEEELTCRLCGEAGHFAQGCPTTLGGNRKPGEVVERIPFRDKRLKPRIIGTGGAIVQGIEKDTGCRLKLEDNLTVGNGAFFVKITGPDRMTVNKGMTAINRLVEQVEEEWKQHSQASARKSQQGGERERGGSYRGGGGPTGNPLIAVQTQHIAVQRQQQDNVTVGGPGRRGNLSTPPVDEEKRTIEIIASQLEARRHWEATSGSSLQSLNGSYKEGRSASGPGSLPPAHLLGKVDGRSTYHPESGVSYPVQAEEELQRDVEYDAQNLDELERMFLEETIQLTKDQNTEEDKENIRHRERLREIQEQYQQRMIKLRAKQAQRREEFYRHEAQMRYQSSSALGYSHHQYAVAGGSALPVSPGRLASVYNNDPLPQYEGSYDGSTYDKVYEQQVSTETLQQASLQVNPHDVYSEVVPHSSRPYNRKQGYDKVGYDTSMGHDKADMYDPKLYSYGSSGRYPAYG